MADRRPIAYTDGACPKNGQSDASAGYGVHWDGGQYPNVSEPLTGRQTNQRAELTATRHAIETAKQYGHKELTIRTDSDYVYKSQTEWRHNWEKNDYRGANGRQVENRQDFEDLRNASRGMDVRYEKVKAHSGDRGNEEADRLARDAARRAHR